MRRPTSWQTSWQTPWQCALFSSLILLAGCTGTRRAQLHTFHERIVTDTLVISQGTQAVFGYHATDTLRVDTGRLRLQIVPIPLPPAATLVNTDRPPHPARYTHRITAECTPDTLRIPRIIRERTHQRCHCPPARSDFWHYSGYLLWLLLLGAGLWAFARR